MIKKRFISMLVLLMTVVSGAWAQDTYKIDAVYTYTANNGQSLSQDLSIDDAASLPFTIKLSELDPFSMSKEEYNTNATNITVSGDNIVKGTDANWDTEITINGAGTATVSNGLQSTEYGDIGSATITFTVTKNAPATVAVTGVTLAPTSATLTLGETETVTLIPTVLPNDATDKSVTWSSSNEAVATVADGVVTAVAAGTATITVTTTDGAKTATCAVTVAAPAPSTYTVTVKEGTEDATNWTITPAEATTTGVAAGTEVKATYGGAKKVKSVKAVKKSAAPAEETVTWDNTNVFVSGNSSVTVDKDNPYTYGGVSISFSGDSWLQLYDSGQNVTKLIVQADDVCTFTAPSGKKFTKIEITDNSFATFTAYGDWTMDGDKTAIWSGTASNTVTLGSSNSSFFTNLKSIVFTMEEAAAKPAATVTTAPTAKTGVKAGEDVAIVNEGAAEGGTMMYMVNATQPASTDGFSATVPTAEGLTAGTYYVWYYVKADDSHTDSEISATGIEVTIAAAETTITWDFSEMTGEDPDLYEGYTYKDVTLSGEGELDSSNSALNIYSSCTFTAPTGKHFKKIVINATGMANISGSGWSGGTWTGDASSVTISGWAEGITSFVFTLE